MKAVKAIEIYIDGKKERTMQGEKDLNAIKGFIARITRWDKTDKRVSQHAVKLFSSGIDKILHVGTITMREVV